MFQLPKKDNPLREKFTVEDLLPYGCADGKRITFQEALASAEAALADKAVTSVNCVAVSKSGQVWLIEISRSGVAFLWYFGGVEV